jgi:hypothetical protein
LALQTNKLKAEEIENPIKVIDDFFQCYHLPAIRVCLQDWLQDALSKETIEVKEHVRTHAQVERLVEAVSSLVGSAVGSVNPGKYANRSLVYARGHEKKAWQRVGLKRRNQIWKS